MDQEQDAGAAVSRGQNQLHVLPEDWQATAAVIEPLYPRVEADADTPRLVVLTNDSEAAVAIAGRIAPAAAEHHLRVLAASDARRATRVQRSARAQVIVSPPSVLVELVQSAVVKLHDVRAIVLAWVESLDAAGTKALEALMTEIPKDAARLVIVDTMSSEAEQLVERYARRARRVQSATVEPLPAVSLSYMAVGETTRLAAVRRLLDALDPESAFVVASNPESQRAVESLLRSLGYSGDSAVRVGDTPDDSAQLVVLFDLPASEEELRRLGGGRSATRVIALVTPRQISALRRFAGGTVTPFALPEAAVRARTREDATRDELRETLKSGQFSRELLALEPLLSEYDGTEIAAAALRLLELERTKPRTTGAAASQPALTRLYVNVGTMDSVRPGDLVGAITNEAGISKEELGRIDVRERHSTVEVATPVANSVVAKLTGVSIRGRRVIARVDEERERRAPGTGDVSRGEREPRGLRGARPARPPRPPRDDVRLGSPEDRRKR